MDNKSLTNTVRVKKLPFVIKNGRQMTILKSNIQSKFPPNVRVSALYREDVIHDTTDVYFLKGEFQRMTLVNKLNVVTKCSRTIARYFSSNGAVVEKTSDNLIEVIGQEQYKTVLTALCSILDQELKIRSILALLTNSKKPVTSSIVKDFTTDSVVKDCATKECQTYETRIEPLKIRPRKRIRKQVGPYIVPDFKTPETKARRVIVNIPNLKTESDELEGLSNSENYNLVNENSNSLKNFDDTDKSVELDESNSTDNFDTLSISKPTESLPDLGHLQDDYSNDSIGLQSVLSETPTLPDLLTNPKAILNNVDQHTKQLNYSINMFGKKIFVPFKPETLFHMASKENLMYLDEKSRAELKQVQMMYDYNHCLTVMDEDGNLPLHLAVMNNDLELLNRHCIILKIKGRSLDILANGLTALKLSLYQEPPVPALSSTLIRHGADPLCGDVSNRTCAHVAAERDADLLRVVLQACQDKARNILMDNEDLWKPGMESQSDEELAQILMTHMCSMFDKHGYTPLMLASMLGLYENVRILLEHAPNTINLKMPTSGNTALYLAVAAACNSSSERGNKSKVVDHFRKTIEILLDHSSNPAIDNYSGSNVNTLLTEFNCAELSMLVANKLTQANFSKTLIPETTKDFDKLMLVMDKQGNVEYKALENEKKKKADKNEKKIEIIDNSKPIIVENIMVKSPITSNTDPTSDVKSSIVDKSTKLATVLNLKQILITTKNQLNPVVTETETKVIPTTSVSTNKRKILDTPNILKHSKKGK